jgi:glycosyltransferase involved in cell wall biosynthesis
MISVVTPTYNTPPHILARTFASLKAQTFTDWEWVVYDDSTDDRVWRQLWGFCADERYNIRPLRGMSNSGNIGKVKRTAFMAA